MEKLEETGVKLNGQAGQPGDNVSPCCPIKPHQRQSRKSSISIKKGGPTWGPPFFFCLVLRTNTLLHHLDGAGGTVGVGGNDDGHAVS